MSVKNYLTLKLTLNDKHEGAVGCIVYVKDKHALARFSNSKVAKRIYFAQKKLGKKVVFMERVNGFAENFPDKTKEEIIELLKEQLKQGGEFDEVK